MLEDKKNTFKRLITEHLYNYYYQNLGLVDWEMRVSARVNEVQREAAILKTIEYVSHVNLSGKKMLNIGCGWGGSVVAALEMGIKAFGCDIDLDVLKISRLRSQIHKVPVNYVLNKGECLPFPDNTFDYIQCVSVLEHVNDVELCISEMVRVLKENGTCFIQAPNYWQPIERHYKVLFPPKCPKFIGKIFLLLIGRPGKFLDTVNYISYRQISNIIKKYSVYTEDIEGKFTEIFQESRKNDSAATLTHHYNYTLNYNKLVAFIMAKLIPPVISFWERVLNVRQIYFLLKKQTTD